MTDTHWMCSLKYVKEYCTAKVEYGISFSSYS